MNALNQPHTVTVESPTLGVTSQVVDGETFGAPVSISCLMAPGKARAIFDQFNIELDSPFMLITDPANESLFVSGARVTWNGVHYFVRTFETYTGFGISDNTTAILEKEKQT